MRNKIKQIGGIDKSGHPVRQGYESSNLYILHLTLNNLSPTIGS